MLAAWSEASPEPEMKAGIEQFLLAVDEIEDDTKVVRGIPPWHLAPHSCTQTARSNDF